MKIEFDPAKNERNIRERGLSFEMAREFDWEGALLEEDTRFPYPERRFVVLGFVKDRLKDRLHVLCFTPISGGIRIISFRKANDRELRRYEQKTSNR